MAVDKLVDSTQLDADLTDIADAIRAKTGKTADLTFPADFVSEIGSISGGGEEADFKDVNLYDYDGTRLYSYTAEEFLALEALPPNPSHDLLSADGWNWDLLTAQTYVRKYRYCEIGQNYHPTDNSTLVRLTIGEGDVLDVTLNVQGEVDWGDGSEKATYANATNVTHTYPASGSYVVHIHNTSGTWNFDAPTASKVYVTEVNFASNTTLLETNKMQTYVNLEKVSFARNSIIRVRVNVLNGCSALKAIIFPYGFTTFDAGPVRNLETAKCIIYPPTVQGKLYLTVSEKQRQCTIPEGVTTVDGNGNRGTPSMEHIVYPDSATTLTNHTFNGVRALKTVHFPQSITSETVASNQSWASCNSLEELTIPEGVLTMQNFSDLYRCKKITMPSTLTSFDGCSNVRNLREFHIKATTPPTKASPLSLNNIYEHCKIYVPYSEDHSILEAYQTATNWSTYASHMQEETP